MQLPINLRDAIEEELQGVKPDLLAKAAAELSVRYRLDGPPGKAFISTEIHTKAYLATRFPATYRAALAVFSEISNRLPEMAITSLLDLGAGSGAATWAAAALFEELQTATLIERDRTLIDIGKRLSRHAHADALRSAQWLAARLETGFDVAPHDIVVLSYALGELRPQAQTEVIRRAWETAANTVVVIEPGTMNGYDTMIQARRELLKLGARALAPCPHGGPCPMLGVDWCHFSARLERAAFHRRAKAGTMPYEDEKFSYFAGSKLPSATPAASRIVRHPMIFKGHIRLELCATDGLKRLTVTKSNKEAFRQARKAEWGDAWPVDSEV